MVVSSNLTAATKVALLPEDIENLPIRELLELLLGEEGKRRLRLRYMTNDQLFEAYDSELVMRNQSAKGLKEARRVLGHFRDFLGSFPPSPELGKQFLSQFTDRKVTTKARYAQVLSSFFKWHGEDLGVRVRVPHKLPQYTEDKDIEALLQAIATKATHKKTLTRDSLLIELALNTGLRRAELANLRIGDIHLDQGMLIVRNGKGGKDATLPLNETIAAKLRSYIRSDMTTEQRLFGLKPSSISNKIERFAKKAGVNIHCHSLRHYFGTKLVEAGANPEAVRQLMRHEDLGTTQRYISLAGKGLVEAVRLLDHPEPQPAMQTLARKTADGGPKFLQKLDELSESGKKYLIIRDVKPKKVP